MGQNTNGEARHKKLQPKDGIMEEELERKAKTPRKLAKISFWDAEEKKLEKVGALIATESQGQERVEAEQLEVPEQPPTDRAGLITHQALHWLNTMEYRVERTGDVSTKCQSGGPNL
jgi:hypothetical protein